MGERCQPDDPRRCQQVTRHGQCVYLATLGSENCDYHNGGTQKKANEQAKQERYLIDNHKLRETYKRQFDDANYLNMKEEIILLQALFERRINAMKDDSDIIMTTGAAVQLAQRLESMKTTLLKMQMQLGIVLGKDALRILARDIADVLDDELEGVPDKYERLERISERIVEAIEIAGRTEEE